MIRVKNLALLLALTLLMGVINPELRAQEKDAKPGDKPAEAAAPAPAKEESSITDHTIKIGGQAIPYKATAATILLKNEKDEPAAVIYFTAYTRSDVKDLDQRPVSFVYNGGPGSATIWLHMGALGPKRVALQPDDFLPPAPYHIADNPHIAVRPDGGITATYTVSTSTGLDIKWVTCTPNGAPNAPT